MLEHEQARHIFKLIKASSLVALRHDLFIKAIEYSRIRAHWQMASHDQRKDMDQLRTIAHNSFIDACNILSRNMGLNDEDNEWRAALGDDRKIIGDMACFIQFFVSIDAR